MAASTATRSTHVVADALFRRIQREVIQLDRTQRASNAADLFARL